MNFWTSMWQTTKLSWVIAATILQDMAGSVDSPLRVNRGAFEFRRRKESWVLRLCHGDWVPAFCIMLYNVVFLYNVGEKIECWDGYHVGVIKRVPPLQEHLL